MSYFYEDEYPDEDRMRMGDYHQAMTEEAEEMLSRLHAEFDGDRLDVLDDLRTNPKHRTRDGQLYGYAVRGIDMLERGEFLNEEWV